MMDNNFEEALEPVAVVEDAYPVATEDVMELTDDAPLGEKIAKIAIAALTAVLTFIGGLTVIKWLKNKIKAKKEAKKEAAPVEEKITPVPVEQPEAEKKEETPATAEQKPEK